jgi:hypothetical protein
MSWLAAKPEWPESSERECTVFGNVRALGVLLTDGADGGWGHERDVHPVLADHSPICPALHAKRSFRKTRSSSR